MARFSYILKSLQPMLLQLRLSLFKVKFFWRYAAVGFLVFAATHTIHAALTPVDAYLAIEIDGKSYGQVDSVDGLPSKWNLASSHKAHQVTLKRGFLTQPSLSLWAKNSLARRTTFETVELIERSSQGRVLQRWTLKACQPLSWSVETDELSLGGYHEVVKLAVQQIY